jgi:hypothetical protein
VLYLRRVVVLVCARILVGVRAQLALQQRVQGGLRCLCRSGPPNRMGQQLNGPPVQDGRVIERVAVPPFSAGITAIADLREKRRLVSVSPSGQSLNGPQQMFGRFVKAYEPHRVAGHLLDDRTLLLRRCFHCTGVAVVRRGIEMQANLMAALGNRVHGSAARG